MLFKNKIFYSHEPKTKVLKNKHNKFKYALI